MIPFVMLAAAFSLVVYLTHNPVKNQPLPRRSGGSAPTARAIPSAWKRQPVVAHR